MSPLPLIDIYTDGGCDPNPGPGGWAALLLLPTGPLELSGGEAHTTNNRMELTAAIQALRALPAPASVTLHTDSQYVQRGMTEWLPNWIKRNWRSTTGKVANQDLWQALLEAMKPHSVRWVWVRGHAGNPNNERVDRMVHAARRKYKNG